jgi:hypothetical protein
MDPASTSTPRVLSFVVFSFCFLFGDGPPRQSPLFVFLFGLVFVSLCPGRGSIGPFSTPPLAFPPWTELSSSGFGLGGWPPPRVRFGSTSAWLSCSRPFQDGVLEAARGSPFPARRPCESLACCQGCGPPCRSAAIAVCFRGGSLRPSFLFLGRGPALADPRCSFRQCSAPGARGGRSFGGHLRAFPGCFPNRG